MTRKEILDEARRLNFGSPRWDELFAAAANDPTTRDELQHLELMQYRREEFHAGCY